MILTMMTLYDIEKAYQSDYGPVAVAPIEVEHQQVQVMLLDGSTSLGDAGDTSWVPREDVVDPTPEMNLTW